MKLRFALPLLLLCSCGFFSEDSSNKGQSVTLNIYSEPPSLDAAECTDTTSMFVLRQIFEGLTRIAPDNKPQLALA